MAGVIGTDRDGYGHGGVAGQLDQAPDEGLLLRRIRAGGEHLLELVYDEDEPLTVLGAGQRAVQLRHRPGARPENCATPAFAAGQQPSRQRRKQAGENERGFAAPGWTDDAE
jgi:hypothetical protein